MVRLYAFPDSFRIVLLRAGALAFCSAAIVASVTPASARPASASPASAKSHHHGAGRLAHAHHARHHAGRHHNWRHHAYRHDRRYRHIARASRWERGVAQMHSRGFTHSYVGLGSSGIAAASSGFASSNVVAEARRYIGGNPTGRGSLWCARFMNMVLQRSGYRGTGSDMARSFASYGQRVSGPEIGAIAVMGRRGGGHVGVVSGIEANGNPILVSGNNRNRVREAPYPRGRIYAYVMPTS
jgi:uncharacterized protein (TIGR02594 family)